MTFKIQNRFDSMTGNKKEFIRAYVECALWSSSDDDDTPLDANYTIEDFNLETFEQAVTDCKNFLHLFNDTITTLNIDKGYDFSQAGHDFWLTRCGHGAGFWDRDLGESGDKMTSACGHGTQFANVDLYTNEGKIFS